MKNLRDLCVTLPNGDCVSEKECMHTVSADVRREGEEPELLPCPFCGGEVSIGYGFRAGEVFWYLSCLTTTCLADSMEHPDHEQLVEWWNTRAPAQPPSSGEEDGCACEDHAHGVAAGQQCLCCDMNESAPAPAPATAESEEWIERAAKRIVYCASAADFVLGGVWFSCYEHLSAVVLAVMAIDRTHSVTVQRVQDVAPLLTEKVMKR